MKIAIIGSGISGLGTAYLLHPHHDICVYEQNDYLGGHSRTLEVTTPDGPVAVDTGFIVFNRRNYPNLCGLFDHLDVPVSESDMSFGVSINNGWLEYGTRRRSNLFAQKRNLLRPEFWQMLRGILHFNKSAPGFLAQYPDASLRECLDHLQLSPWFKDYYLLAMSGAIWSTPVEQMLDFPAATLIRFFDNHGLLTVNDHPQWYTVRGGSREYVRRLIEPFQDKIYLNRGVQNIQRDGSEVTITDVTGKQETYDAAILACHSDQALKLIDNPTEDEQAVLGNIRTQENSVILHSDTSFMPQRRKAWASWVYLSYQQQDTNPALSLTYWMNNLQPLGTEHPILVTLNPGRKPAPELTHNEHIFHHPVFDRSAIEAQKRLESIQGCSGLWFCGAWQTYGFHEDGFASAVRVAQSLGIQPPWK